MNLYSVERMTNEDYHKMMCGYISFNVETLWIEANSRKEAFAKAKKVGYIVNENVLTAEEVKKEEEEREARAKAYEEKQAKAKQKRKEAEEKKALEAGLTVEEYRKEKARKAKITRLENEIETLEEELKNKRKELDKIKNL